MTPSTNSNKIILGDSSLGRPLKLDIDLLIPSRLLIQANSGGGKSWLLRRLAEQLWGKVQTIILDPEGEFFTLREKFGYVLVGEGGETPADIRSATLLAEKFLQLKASAVCDLYEAFRAKPMDRRQWVRAFLNALLDAPRSLWHPLIVIVDEAHKFCPQETPKAASMQDREIIGGCKDAMIALSTTGRKRGFCPIWATQRLAKLDKDASAEFFNRLVGMTIEDVDVDRAADLMSVSKEDKHDFRNSLRTLNPGQFYAFGRAITIERSLVMVGEVQTHHPETGAAAKNSEPPPMPDEVRAFLPQLADLPQEVEKKAKTEEELRAEIRSLKSQLSVNQRAVKVEPTDPRVIERAVRDAVTPLRRQIERTQTVAKEVGVYLTKAGVKLGEIAEFAPPTLPAIPIPISSTSSSASASAYVSRSRSLTTNTARNGDGDSNVDLSNLTGPEQRILNAIAWLNTVGVREPEQTAVAFLAGYTTGGGAFNNPRGRLNQRGLVEYLSGERIRLTSAGQKVAQAPDTPLDAEELQRMVLARLPGPERKILSVLLSSPDHIARNGLTNEDLAERAGYAPNGGAYNNPRGRLRSLGLIDYVGGRVVPKPLLFLEDTL